ncbi:MAG: hypothetical protein L3J47_12090 [Sulfurovum sp.]|nr:hypothetical protein [Sulfurovum sp.]
MDIGWMIIAGMIVTAAAFIAPDVRAWYERERRWKKLTKNLRRRKR